MGTQPPIVVTEEMMNQMAEELIDKSIPHRFQRQVRALIKDFCGEGKGNMLGLIERANEMGKIQEVLVIIERDIQKHWKYWPTTVRGRVVTTKDEMVIRDAYRELGIPLPAPTGGSSPAEKHHHYTIDELD